MWFGIGVGGLLSREGRLLMTILWKSFVDLGSSITNLCYWAWVLVIVALVATAAEVAACLSILTAAAESVVKGCLLALAACCSWLVKAMVLSSCWWLMWRNSRYSRSSSSYVLMMLPAVILLSVWQGMVVLEVIVGRGMWRYGVVNVRWFVITGSCAVKLCLLSGRGKVSLVGGILMRLYILLRASAMTFFWPSRCSMVVSSWLRDSCHLMSTGLVCRDFKNLITDMWSVIIVSGCPCKTLLKCVTLSTMANNSFLMTD